MDLTSDHLLQIASNTVSSGPSAPPDGLRRNILARIVDAVEDDGAIRRHDNRGTTAAGQTDALRSFITTVSELGAVLESLPPDEWARPARIVGGTVRQPGEHLVGGERPLLGCLGHPPILEAPRRQEPWPVSRRAATGIADERDEILIGAAASSAD